MKTTIQPHHQHAIDNLTKAYEQDERFDALIIGGSVAKGCARTDSDIDFMIVANDHEFLERSQRNDLFINRTDLTDYEGGFVDGKIISMDYLLKVESKGNEPSRAAFDGAFVTFSRIPGLTKTIKNIAVYPDELRDQKLRTFYSMAFIQNWLMGEAEKTR